MTDKKIDRRVARTKRNIIKSFVDLLKIKEIQKISITEIARNADIDRKTFYLHFDNVFDVITEIENNVVRSIEERISVCGDFNIKRLIEIFNIVLSENEEFFVVASENKLSMFFSNRFEKIIVNLLSCQLDANGNNSLKDEYKLKYIASGIVKVYLEWIRNNKNLSVEELSSLLGNLVNADLKLN